MAEPASSREDIASLLKWYVDQGLDETIGEEAIDRFALPATATASVPARDSAPTPIRPAVPPPQARAPVPLESPQLVEDADRKSVV